MARRGGSPVHRSFLAATALACLWTGPSIAETRTALFGAPFCTTRESLRTLINAMVARNESAAVGLDDCLFFKPGVKVEILKVTDEPIIGFRVVQIRKRGNGEFVDGYTMSNDLIVMPDAVGQPADQAPSTSAPPKVP